MVFWSNINRIFSIRCPRCKASSFDNDDPVEILSTSGDIYSTGKTENYRCRKCGHE